METWTRLRIWWRTRWTIEVDCEIKVGLIEVLFFQSVDINNEINGRAPIHFAADYGQAQVLDYLISKGADVDVSNPHRFRNN